MSESSDLLRLKSEYADRHRRFFNGSQYSLFNPAYLFMLQTRERVVLQTLAQCGFLALENYRILEVGCGSGGVLREYLRWGAKANQLYGIDLLFNRVVEAHSSVSDLMLACANGQFLPYADHSFDIVLQYTAISSILDPMIKKDVACEMLRVLRPDGIILWHDFWLNPVNKQTKGIRPAEIKALFPHCKYSFQKTILAPPIARRVVPFSLGTAHFLESLSIFNTHYVASIRKII